MVLIVVFAIKRHLDSSPCETKNVLSFRAYAQNMTGVC